MYHRLEYTSYYQCNSEIRCRTRIDCTSIVDEGSSPEETETKTLVIPHRRVHSP
ncbi:hypothetical protein PISMIDRAFT_675817 [Pisolithus microcarpus 441]|uniref:Uncharacterized protein n=1 Tax=Pisolithus microcarpus 441 TaxID=765257 RepID=A0A0C9YN98_9AGAM|nr:hypothetical protein PISMIDRAFT_675817 [Pisolithus microcarpus 441]